MELNREQITKALECCTRSGCSDNETKDCPLKPYEDCRTRLAIDALSLIKELTEENERLRANTDILDEEYTKTAKRFYKEGVKDMKERIEALFPSDKKFTTISLFTLVQTAKELKGE